MSVLAPAGAFALGIAPAVIAQEADERRVANTRQARIDAAQHLDGTEQAFLLAAADALGLDWHGGNEQQIEDLLMGLGDRSDLQKAQLHNLLNGSFTSQGNDTWTELMRLWGGEEMDMGRMNSILQALADAYTRIPETDAEWWKQAPDENGVTSEDMKNLNSIPGEVGKAVREGMAGITIEKDGEKVAAMVSEKDIE